MSASTTYSLKKIVLARALAELTVLLILALLPIILIVFGKFFALHFMLRIMLGTLSLVAIWLLWGMSKINFKLTISENCLSSRSILKSEKLAWPDLISIKQNSSMGWREFQISHKAGQLSFPAMFEKQPELIEEIRSRLPNRGRATNIGAQVFKLSKLVFAFELTKVIFQLGFAALIFMFYESLRRSGHSVQEDLILILGMAIIVAAVVIWKFIQTLMMIQEAQVDKDGLQLKGFFTKTQIAWADISKTEAASLLYPEGMIVTANKKNYLIANNIDAFDELSEELNERLKGR